MKSKVISLGGFILVVLGFYYLILNEWVFSRNPVSISIQVGAVILMIWSRITFGIRSFHASADTTKGALVTHGPYKFLRHPIYASIIYFSWSILISYPCLRVLLAVILISGGLFLRMVFEEKELLKTYPEVYEAYSKKAKRIIPYLF